MPEIRTKTVTVKADDDTRSVTARFATLGVVDHDGDIIEAGAIGEQSVFMGAYNHDFAMLPPGMGATWETDDEAMFRGEFFDTWSGDQHYKTIKEAGGQMDWSFRFFVEEGGWETRAGDEFYVIRKARVTHVAPVESGAGINTGTVEVKSCGPECQAEKLARSKGEGTPVQAEGIDYEKLMQDLKAVVDQAVAAALATAPKAEDDCGCGSKSDDATDPAASPDPDDATDPATASSDAGTASQPPESANSAADADSTPSEPANSGDSVDNQGDSVDNQGDSVGKASKAPERKGEGLGDLLRQLRDEKELTNDDLADAAGLSVSSIGSILAGTTGCPKIGQLQGMARRLGVSLSSLLVAAEKDGCEDYGGSDQSSANDQGQDKSEGAKDAPDASTEPGNDPNGGETELTDEMIAKQVDALLSGFPGLPSDIDPGIKAWHQFQIEVLEPAAAEE